MSVSRLSSFYGEINAELGAIPEIVVNNADEIISNNDEIYELVELGAIPEVAHDQLQDDDEDNTCKDDIALVDASWCFFIHFIVTAVFIWFIYKILP